MSKGRGWDRLLWGVRFTSAPGYSLMIGSSWDSQHRERYAGEPTRALLFMTRQQARSWCRQKHEFYLKYPEGHICRGWRFRPERVRERISVALLPLALALACWGWG